MKEPKTYTGFFRDNGKLNWTTIQASGSRDAREQLLKQEKPPTYHSGVQLIGCRNLGNGGPDAATVEWYRKKAKLFSSNENCDG